MLRFGQVRKGSSRADHYTGDKCVGSLTSPTNYCREDAGDGAHGFSSSSEKTRMFNRLQIS